MSASAPFIPAFSPFGDYEPYVATAEMKRPRYLHEAVSLRTGFVYVLGGSDERGLSAIDTLEIFDQSTFDRNQTPPESKAGLWIDTDFEGDPISFVGGPRIYFTASEISDSDNRLLMVGGTANLLQGEIHGRAELFDPETRTFEEIAEEMLTARFRHSMVRLTSGDFLVVGGQELTTITTELLNFVVVGVPNLFQETDVFPSIRTVESFSLRDGVFSEVFPAADSTRPSTLHTPRGRAGHTMVRVAGPNNRLNNADDLFVIVGGFETLSAASGLAPQTKQPGRVAALEAEASTSVEVFDPLTRLFTLIASVRLTSGRINFPQAINLGQFNDFTIDGVAGMGNALLITGGNTDAGCPETPFFDQLFIANYLPGGGPAGGLRFFEVEDLEFFTHVQGSEYPDPANPQFHARSAVNFLAMPRRVPATVPGVDDAQSWVFALGGVFIFVTPTGCAWATEFPEAMAAGSVFDPYFNVRAALNSGLSPRDLVNERRTNSENFLGIVGAWLVLDGAYPTDTMDNYGGTPFNRFPATRAGDRIYTKLVPLAGVDGLLGSFDDRVLLVGGGRSFFDNGGEPTAPSAEIIVTPGAAER